MKRLKGFTLIELLVALVLLALLVSAAAPLMQMTAKRNKEQELKKALWQIRDAIDAYKQAADDGLIKKSVDENGYPTTLQQLVDGVENMQDAKKRKLYFLRRIPRDPFAVDATLSLKMHGASAVTAALFLNQVKAMMFTMCTHCQMKLASTNCLIENGDV